MEASATPPRRLRLLGDAALLGPDGAYRLERKAAGLLAYLALAGPTSRQRLAGLLWPEVPESRARNSLAQLVMRLRRVAYPQLVAGGAVLALDEALEVDAATLELRAFDGEAADPSAYAGELLQNFEYDDCDEFAEWLQAARDAARRAYASLLDQRIQGLEAAGALNEALRLADRLVALDPLAEPSHRLVMRLHAARGDRAAALRAYAACRATLAAELGVEPDERTRALAAEITRDRPGGGGAATVPATAASGTAPPRTVAPDADAPDAGSSAAAAAGDAVRARPGPDATQPRRVGRESEWARVQAALGSGLPVFVSGPPGMGKSRLAHDLLSERGAYALVAARPGDAAVPLLTLSRAYRRLLAEFPGLDLEPWVEAEIGRLVPELVDAPPAPMTSAEDRLRFEEAVFRLHEAAARVVGAFLFDDLQFADPVSLETWERATTRLLEAGVAVPTLHCFRSGEVAEAFLARLAELAARGAAVHVQLTPLDDEALALLVADLGGLDAAAAGALAADLQRYTGGNPLFAIEVLRYLHRTGRLGARLPEGLPPPGRVGAVVRQRLARLSPGAMRAAQTAAVLQSDFELELVATLLETPAATLLGSWEELERAGIVVGGRFGHDVVHEVVLSDMARPVRELLHRRAAAALARASAPAARVAQHWLAGGKQREALPALLAAGAEAEAGFRLLEARGFYGRAAAIAELLGDTDAAFEALARELELLLRDDTGERPTLLLERLEAAARTDAQRAQAAVLAATHHNTRGEPYRAEERARAALDGPARHADPLLRARLLDALATSLSEQNRFEEALTALEAAAGLLREHGSQQALAHALVAIGAVLNRAGRDAAALPYQLEARAVFAAAGERQMTAVADMHVGVSHEALADHTAAEAAYLAADAALRAIPGTARFRYNNSINLGYLYWGLERYADALRFLDDAETHEPATAHSRAIVARIKALVFRALGAVEAFEREVEEALRRPDRTDPWRSHGRIVWADELACRGRLAEARQLFDALERDLGDAAPPLLRAHLHLARAAHFDVAERLEHAERAERLQRAFQLPLRAEVALRRAEAQLVAGDAEAALRHAREALAHHAEEPLLGPRAALPFALHRALAALGLPGADAELAAAHRHVLAVADAHVPPEHRAGFLARNRLNAAIVAAVRAAGGGADVDGVGDDTAPAGA